MARPERFELPTLWFEVRRFLSYLVLTFCGRQLAKLEDLTTYNFIYSAVDEKPEGSFKSLKKMVGASGFEPPTSWSRTRRASQAALRPDREPTSYNSLRRIARGLCIAAHLSARAYVSLSAFGGRGISRAPSETRRPLIAS